jgi:hypothetical protein
VFVYFVFIRFYKASISVTYLAITVNTIWFCDEDFSFSFCSLCFSVSGVCLFCTLHFLNWVCWVRGNFSGEPGRVYISCAYLSSVWSGGPVQFIWVLRWCGRRDCTDFLFSLALQWRVRHGRIGEGGGPFFFCFLQFAVCFLGGWISAVGICCVIFCDGSFVVFFRGFLFSPRC